MPQIVRATVKRAREGSLPHVKWLWEMARAAESGDAAGGQKSAEQSFSLLLMEQLKRGT